MVENRFSVRKVIIRSGCFQNQPAGVFGFKTHFKRKISFIVVCIYRFVMIRLENYET